MHWEGAQEGRGGREDRAGAGAGSEVKCSSSGGGSGGSLGSVLRNGEEGGVGRGGPALLDSLWAKLAGASAGFMESDRHCA